uniref:Uncharacterized protein n=1 Tax=Chromera velia CCMP2878 TaxID=1169474 RepID=A0A0G4HH62_9ALVE|eukprot:Cvel_27554.t1-p1 / transcript=Cvel_27554.t1 / gene=Cvel_27554 / organism=Chromera_velia_CCMP2878 / gene_product=hypothetical protein / transcript_product=hypothetical protein / location=Cvel_scaffold3461:2590-2817(-) / protein_length=76 / sequence_SO=supercontig / SO=protein_coding / is_pseudo=false
MGRGGSTDGAMEGLEEGAPSRHSSRVVEERADPSASAGPLVGRVGWTGGGESGLLEEAGRSKSCDEDAVLGDGGRD